MPSNFVHMILPSNQISEKRVPFLMVDMRACAVPCGAYLFIRHTGHHICEHHSTRWTANISSKVNCPHAINFRALYGANIGDASKFKGNETLELHRAGRRVLGLRVLSDTIYLSTSCRRSTPPQNPRLNISTSNMKQQVDDLWRS